MSNIKDDKSMSSGGKEESDHKTRANRQPGAGQPAGQRQQSTGQPGSGQPGGHNPNRATQQGGESGSGKSDEEMQSKDPAHKGKG